MEKCSKCNREKEMYYVPWCPYCDKPRRRSLPMLNLLKCLRHIEVITNDLDTYEPLSLNGYKSRVWAKFNDLDYIRGNDTFFRWVPHLSGSEEEADPDFQLLADTFKIDPKEGVLFEVSW